MILTRCDICAAETDEPLYKNELGITELKNDYKMLKIQHACGQCMIIIGDKEREISKEQHNEKKEAIKRFIIKRIAEEKEKT